MTCLFFFSSRRRHTRSKRDWSSDVCSSDLICELPEYYPTRTELELFRRHRAEIAAALGKHKQFVDLGAGDCRKAAGWLGFLAPRRYLAVDIAEQEIDGALGRMARDFPDVEMVGVIMDFSRSLELD